ncbi:putative uncharacterized protein DDB_G0271606 [Palaemon carinicauda]|uniref:putative uncharacterized protein DDB_G0271606 n=1 Tax=Palaemon carinicauda TaxID=392227 RepID=UPI0035B5E588
MSKKAKILHRQTFQNSNNVVELTVKTIPKDFLPSQNTVQKPSAYVRDCGVRKELERVCDKENNNVCSKTSTVPSKKKGNGGRVTVEVSKKVGRREHEIVPKNNTWDNVLRNCSAIESSNESELMSGLRKKRSVSQNLPDQYQAWHQKTSQTPDSEQSNVSELIVNRQIQSETSSQEFVPQQMYSNVNGQNIVTQGRNSSSSSSRNTRKSPRAERSVRRSLRNNVNQQAVPVMQSEQHLQQAKVPGNIRLLSDDATPSPFGASAIELLHQLRQRLQLRGDSEGMDIVGVVEAYIAGQGSDGNVGSSNIQRSAAAVSPGCSPVFPDSTANKQASVVDVPFSTGSAHVPNSTDVHKSCRLPDHSTKPKHFRFDDQQSHGTANSHSHVPASRALDRNSGFQPAPGPADSHPHVPGPQTNCHPGLRPTHFLNDDQNNRNFPPNENHTSQNDELIREIIRQKNIIARQENDILQLRTLSTRLIAMQEKLTSQNQEVDANRNTGINSGQVTQTVRQTRSQECQTEGNHVERPTRDWESNTPSSDRDYQSAILLLQMENDCLKKEVRRLREITMDLQIQLTKAYGDLDSERRSRSRLSGLSSSKLSGSAPNLDLVERQLRGTIPEKLIPEKSSSNQGESEVDSAYEEKTSSRVTSKVGSPHLDRQESRCERGIPDLSSNAKPSSSLQQNQKNYGGFRNSNQHVLEANGQSQETTVPSITRNMSVSSEQIPVYQSAFPSVELLNSNSNSSPLKYDVSKQNYNFNGNQKGPGSSGHNSVKDRPNFPSKRSNHENESVRHSVTPCSAVELNLVDDDLAVLISDKAHREGQVMDDPVYPSFSTVSEDSQNEMTSREDSEFLQGISLPRFARERDTLDGKENSQREMIHSVNELQNPTMESTRVQEVSPPVYTRSSGDYSSVILKGTSTLKSVMSVNVEELH